jgi:hypothetical protein
MVRKAVPVIRAVLGGVPEAFLPLATESKQVDFEFTRQPPHRPT